MKKWYLLLLLLAVAGILFSLNRGMLAAKTQVPAKAEEPTKEETPTPLREATNSEGTMKLVGTSLKTEMGRYKYKVQVVDTKKKKTALLYETVAEAGSVIAIPWNSWSPDDRQVYLEMISPGGTDYLVFKANGEYYENQKKFLRVSDYWDATKREESIKEVSGWAGNNQLMVYTKNMTTGESGSAYWFATGSNQFMRVREF